MLQNIVRLCHCAPTVQSKVLDSDKTLVTSIPSNCANKMAELSFMSVKTATVNKTN